MKVFVASSLVYIENLFTWKPTKSQLLKLTCNWLGNAQCCNAHKNTKNFLNTLQCHAKLNLRKNRNISDK